VVIYLLALVALITLAVLFWRAFVAEAGPPQARRSLGPDDDPEFLSRIDPGATRRHSTDGDADGPGPSSG
jgi:hypothetical protein